MAGVGLPPDGSGKTVDTFTTIASKERQVVLTNCAPPGSGNNWSVAHTPVAATQATATKAAGATGVRLVCTYITFSLAVAATAQTILQVSLRDGATGAGTILWSMNVLKAAGESMTVFSLSGLNIEGSTATAMTIEFSAAGVAASLQSVAMGGYSTA